MNDVADRNAYFVREHVGMFKAANEFDVFDPETGEALLQCREPDLGFITRLARFSDYKRMTPFDIRIQTPDGRLVVRVRRGFTFLRSTIEVLDADDELIGTFRQKLLSIGGAFEILDPEGASLCRLQGKWTGWNFRFLAGEVELAKVSKSWGGLAKELFTTADNYVLQISDRVPAGSPIRLLVLAAVMCIDMVLKE